VQKKVMASTKTLYVDSRERVRGTHSDFAVSLPEQLTLRDSRVRVDNIRTTDTFTTVSSRNQYVYFLNGASLTAVALTASAYTGTTFAAELATKSGRSCTYQGSSNSLQLAYAPATRIIWEDEELKSFPTSAFPTGATPNDPRSINDILGSSASVNDEETAITFAFVTMAPLQDVYLTSHQLMVHESFMPRGQRYALAKLSLFGGLGTTVGGATPDNVFYDLGEHLTLKEVDFQIRDHRGVVVPLTAPISFQLIFEC
jgi:hypothetical protein